MNNKRGIELVLRAESPLFSLALAFDDPVLTEDDIIITLKLLSGSCMMPGGHPVVLRAMSNYQKVKHEKRRFQTLVAALEKALNNHNLSAMYMTFINVLINAPQRLGNYPLKIKIRREFIELGLNDIIKQLKKVSIEEAPQLDTQLMTYDEEKEHDAEEWNNQFQHVADDASSINFDDIEVVFENVKRVAEAGQLEPYLQEMLTDLMALKPTRKGKIQLDLVSNFTRQILLKWEYLGEVDFVVPPGMSSFGSFHFKFFPDVLVLIFFQIMKRSGVLLSRTS